MRLITNVSDYLNTPSGATAGLDDVLVSKQYDWADIAPTTAIIEAVAEAVNQDPHDLYPLYHTIDPDVLDSLLLTPAGATVTVTIKYCGLAVMVDTSGQVTIPATETDGGDLEDDAVLECRNCGTERSGREIAGTVRPYFWDCSRCGHAAFAVR